MSVVRSNDIQMIPIEHITLVNPRSRGRIKFKQIIDNIANLGLKKPITVTPRRSQNGTSQYDLVCGQGRLEAFQALGQTEVPAFVVDVNKEDLMIMSLAENLARRVRSSPELMSNIARLKARGHTYSQIAKKTDLKVPYVKGILRLLTMGEERLLRAVEKQEIPIAVAVTIASSDDADVQRALAEAYAKNTLRGKDLLRARRLIEQRRSRGKRLKSGVHRPKGEVNADSLLKEYTRETARQRVLIKQSKVCETKLLFVVASLRKLLGEEEFVNILREQTLDEMPQHLAEKLNGAKEPS